MRGYEASAARSSTCSTIRRSGASTPDFSADNQGGPISTGNQNFGQPNSWREARTIQLALRFSF
jgi:hypothetical protein